MRLLALAIGMVVSACGFAQARVAFVPTINLSPGGSDALRSGQNLAIGEYATREFSRRGFINVRTSEITRAFRAAGLDPFEPSGFTFPKLIEVGKAVKADFLVLTVIRKSEHVRVERPSFTDMEGRVHLDVWILDVARELPIAEAKRVRGVAQGKPDEVDFQGTTRQLQAARNAAEQALSPWLKDFPIRPQRRR